LHSSIQIPDPSKYQLIAGFKDLRASTEIPVLTLKKCLLSLSQSPKYRILLKTPPENPASISESDSFTFNQAFTAKLTKLRLMIVSGSIESEADRKQIQGKIEEDRRYQYPFRRQFRSFPWLFTIEAAIVRTMKARRSLDHSQLISEVTSQLVGHFVPDVGLIKKCIEREYLSQSERDRRKYEYVA
jgi:cullin 3